MVKLQTIIVASLITTSALALDNGPKAVGCDWTTGADVMNSDVCLIISQGFFAGGVELTALRIGNDPKLYLFENDRARIFQGSSVDTKKIWEGTVETEEAQCRPAGKSATKFNLSNKTTICIYDN